MRYACVHGQFQNDINKFEKEKKDFIFPHRNVLKLTHTEMCSKFYATTSTTTTTTVISVHCVVLQ